MNSFSMILSSEGRWRLALSGLNEVVEANPDDCWVSKRFDCLEIEGVSREYCDCESGAR